MRYKSILKILIIFLLVGGIGACVDVGELREESRRVQLGEAERAKLELKMGAGELRVHGGARDLMEGDFEYNVDRWKPEIEYAVTGKRGILEISQGEASGVPLGDAKNKWDISLNDDVPIDVVINFDAGEGRLDFRGMQLEFLDIDMGVGDLTIDLTGDWEKDLEVDIDGGIGSAKIYLPEHIGVRVKIDGGIGSVNASRMKKSGNVYTNDAYSHSDVSINIKVDAGIGSIDLKLRGSGQ